MANPRKFSEKIALLNQKEAEGKAEFERIMREVSEVSSKVESSLSNLSYFKSRKKKNPSKNFFLIQKYEEWERKKNNSHLRSENLRCSETDICIWKQILVFCVYELATIINIIY